MPSWTTHPGPFWENWPRQCTPGESGSGRRVYLLAESDLNDVRLIRAPELGGYGLDAHWNEDFHHALHTLLTGEKDGYYQDFGGLGQMAKGFREGFIYSGEYSRYRQRRHGSSSRGLPARRFIVFAQNHDQVGNRPLGERLTQLLSFEALKLAAGAIILSPFIPLLFMGEEYGEVAPFQYFISTADPELADAVRRGRREEFAGFGGQAEPPDPQSEETFQRSRLNHSLRQQEPHRVLWDFYRELLRVRRIFAGLGGPDEVEREVRRLRKGAGLDGPRPGSRGGDRLVIKFWRPACFSIFFVARGSLGKSAGFGGSQVARARQPGPCGAASRRGNFFNPGAAVRSPVRQG